MTGSTGRWAPSVAIGLPLALGALLTACGIPTGDSSFREIPSEEILFDLDETSTSTSTTTTTTTIPLVPVTTLFETTTTNPQELVSIYFLSRGRLRPVDRLLPRNPVANELVTRLEEGPLPDEASAGLTSLIEPGLITSATTAGGIVTVDLDPEIFAGIAASDQREAIGQIVLTMSNLRGYGPVLFTIGGEPTRVTKGNGLLSGDGEPVSADDYTVLLVSSTAAGTTTTTTTTTEPPPPPASTVDPAVTVPAEPTATVPG